MLRKHAFSILSMVIVIGSIAYDFVFDFPGKFGDHVLPDQIHNINLSFATEFHKKTRGGSAGNTAYTLGLLKTSHILFATVGRDFGDYKKEFADFGIDTSHVAVYEHELTAIAFGITDKGNNQIWGFSQGAMRRMKELQLSSVATKDDIVHIGPCNDGDGMYALVQQAVAIGVKYIFDPSFSLPVMTDEQLLFGLTHAWAIIGNDYERATITKRIAGAENIFKEKIVITTLGDKGADIEEYGKKTSIPVVSVSKVADTTGAGDAWRGGFLAGLTRGLDIVTCAKMGSVAGAYAVEQFSTQGHTYTPEEFIKRYRQTYAELIEL